jgi:hypothetical protein
VASRLQEPARLFVKVIRCLAHSSSSAPPKMGSNVQRVLQWLAAYKSQHGLSIRSRGDLLRAAAAAASLTRMDSEQRVSCCLQQPAYAAMHTAANCCITLHYITLHAQPGARVACQDSASSCWLHFQLSASAAAV